MINMPSFLLPSTLPAVYSSFSNEIYVHHSSLHPGTIWSAKCGSRWDATLSRVNVTMCLCHRKSVMQAMLSYFIFCHLIAGGLMGFFSHYNGFFEWSGRWYRWFSQHWARKKKNLWLCAKVSFAFYDLWLNANWQKNLLSVSAYTCMADYNILHERVLLVILKKMLSYGFMSHIRYYNNQHVTNQTPSTGLRHPSFNHCPI